MDNSDNPRKRHLINAVCILADRDTKTAAMTNGTSSRRRGPIHIVSDSAICTAGKITV